MKARQRQAQSHKQEEVSRLYEMLDDAEEFRRLFAQLSGKSSKQKDLDWDPSPGTIEELHRLCLSIKKKKAQGRGQSSGSRR